MEGVKNFLGKLQLAQHYEMFVAKGFDLESDIAFLNEDDLNSMYITDASDRMLILNAARTFEPSKEHVLYEWLREQGLEHYFISFVQSELIDLQEVRRLNLPDEQLYDELEITLPGHKRRLERAVRQLNKRQKPQSSSSRNDDDPSSPSDRPSIIASREETIVYSADPVTDREIPVAHGRWGKPRCLLDAKYDFLLLTAKLVSTKNPRDRVDLEFMVDSGSDVVTIRQEVLDTMDLELLGSIQSKGVHASRTKNLYRAHLQIGGTLLEIEVMGESYDSIGSRVIRHFRHYISGKTHIWLKSNYDELPTAPLMTQSSSDTTSSGTVYTSSSQDTSDQSVPSSLEHEVSLSKDQSQGSVQPEEGNDQSQQKIDMAKGNIDIKFDPKIQKDYVQIDKNGIECKVYKSEVDIKSGMTVEKINFSFSKFENGKHSTKADETDKMICDDGEVIDVRPIIAANRKRKGNSLVDYEARSDVLDRNKVLKKSKTLLQDSDNTLRTIGDSSHVITLENDTVHEKRFLGKRSVYYTSQIHENNEEG